MKMQITAVSKKYNYYVLNYFSIIMLIVISEINAFNNFADIQCGQQRTGYRFGKIVGGQEAKKGEFPWLVSITRRGGHFCGGTLINKKFVLTAGHCLCTGVGNEILQPASIKVTLSQHDLSQKNNDAFSASIKSITVHPEYVCTKPQNDIALLELEKQLEWTDSVLPACLPAAITEERHDKFENILATVAGWGWTNEDSSKGGRAKTLQKAKVNVIKNDKCIEWYRSQGKKTHITETQMCAGHEQGGIDACWADSGGPLMTETGGDNQLMVIGVVSTGIGCARPYLPGLYTRVSEFIPWIQETLKK